MDSIEQQIRLKPDPADLAGRRVRRLPRRPRPAYRRASSSSPAPRAAPPAPPRSTSTPTRPRRSRATPGRTRARSTSCSPPTTPTTTRSRSSPGGPPRCCSPPRCRTSASPSCSRCCSSWRPPPGPTRRRWTASVRAVDDDFSAFVFKVQSGMDSAHRDRLAYARVCSGVFERGMVVTHGETGRPFATKYAQAVFGRERSSVETAFPGDVIGLVNANALRVGDTIYAGRAGALPADRQLRPRALRDRARRRLRPLQAVPQRHRAARPGGRGAGAALGPARRPVARCSPRSARCSSRSCWPGWSRSSRRRCASSGSTTAWPGVPTPPARRRCAACRSIEVLAKVRRQPPRAVPRPVARQDRAPGTTPTCCSRPCPPAPADPPPDTAAPPVRPTKEGPHMSHPHPELQKPPEPAPERPARRRPRRPGRDRSQHDRLRARRASC